MSTSGSMSAPFRQGLAKLGVGPLPDHPRPGEVARYSVPVAGSRLETVLVAAVVAAVDPTPESTAQRVQEATRRAGAAAARDVDVVAVPMLGTGAGGLDGPTSARALISGFLETSHPRAQLVIYVQAEGQVEPVLDLIHQLTSPSPAPDLPLRPGTRELLRVASAIAVARGSSEVTEADVVVGCLYRSRETALDPRELENGATAELVRSVSDLEAGLARALAALDARWPDRDWPADREPGRDDPMIARLTVLATSLAHQAGAQAVYSHHLVAAALTASPVPDDVLIALGTTSGHLKEALLRGIGSRWGTDERLDMWNRLLRDPLRTGVTHLLHDQPSPVDWLGRKVLAEELAITLRDLAEAGDRPEAFALHLDAKWGAGKTTVVKFLASSLEGTKPPRANRPFGWGDRWTIINLDAWRSSQLSPAWWAIFTHVRRGVRGSLGPLERLRFDVRRAQRSLGRNRQRWLPTVLIVAVGAVLAHYVNLGDMVTQLGALAALTTVVGAFATQFFTLGSLQSARLYERLSSNPMEEVAAQIADIQGSSRRHMLLVVDDLDRCSEQFTVELLDALQTLLRNSRPTRKPRRRPQWWLLPPIRPLLRRMRWVLRLPVRSRRKKREHRRPAALVVLAVGDGRWLRAAYEHNYQVFTPYVKEPGRPLGILFLDKLFQVHLELPTPGPAQMATYLQHLLDEPAAEAAESGDLASFRKQIEEAHEVGADDAHSLDNRLSAIMGSAARLPATEREQLAAAAMEVRRQDPLRTERERHLLEDYLELIEPNPRAAKRFVMAYGLAYASRMLDPHPPPAETLALWTLLTLRWPTLSDWIRSEIGGPGPLKSVEEPGHPSELLLDPEVMRVRAWKVGGPLDDDALRLCCGCAPT